MVLNFKWTYQTSLRHVNPGQQTLTIIWRARPKLVVNYRWKWYPPCKLHPLPISYRVWGLRKKRPGPKIPVDICWNSHEIREKIPIKLSHRSDDWWHSPPIFPWNAIEISIISSTYSIEVSWNGGTPKSSIWIGCLFINHIFRGIPFIQTPISIPIINPPAPDSHIAPNGVPPEVRWAPGSGSGPSWSWRCGDSNLRSSNASAARGEDLGPQTGGGSQGYVGWFTSCELHDKIW